MPKCFPKWLLLFMFPWAMDEKCYCIHHMSSNTWYYFILIFSSIVSMKWYPIVIFIFISLITNEVGYLFICLWANCVFMHSTNTVWVPPICQALLGSLFHVFEIAILIDCPFFPLGCFPFSKEFFICSRNILCWIHVLQILPLSLCLAFLLYGIFWWTEALNFNVVRSFFLHCF